MNYEKKLLLSGLLCGLVIFASSMPAAGAGNGPVFTPLVPFPDGTVGRHIWTVPGVIKKNGWVTEFLCTSLDHPGTTAQIGVEIFDNTGTPLNNISVVPAPGATMSLRCFSVTSATASVMGEL